MITRTVKAQLLAFATVTAIGVSYVGAEYTGLVDDVLGRGYTVRADFADSGGIFPGAEVTYRGVPVGRVGALRLTGSDGVSVALDIKDGAPRIPADTLAVVANRSAVGEQYVDLQPRTSHGPYLLDGSAIPRGSTRVPLATTDLVLSLDGLVNSVGKDDLRITVDELGKAFSGTGPNLKPAGGLGQRARGVGLRVTPPDDLADRGLAKGPQDTGRPGLVHQVVRARSGCAQRTAEIERRGPAQTDRQRDSRPHNR